MRRTAVMALAVVALIAMAAGHLQAHAPAPARQSQAPDDSFSPLFSKRLEVGVQNMDKPADRVYTAGLLMYAEEATPWSLDPASICIGSACPGSVCLGSGCLGSLCFGSACSSSKCVGSGCAVSICAGSVCAGSTCAGSVCAGSVCAGSVCVGSVCVGSVCPGCATDEPPGGEVEG